MTPKEIEVIETLTQIAHEQSKITDTHNKTLSLMKDILDTLQKRVTVLEQERI